ncbi:ketose-bisphosphate aldolase [Tessaracoccus sp. OS52]|uniref:ketose-bisphosphate aldolase n=1 Tax=Tessaracoccus sp. OS52 TaxID=2886691 RepID=UPI001D1092DD|nr:ketose-bisphosphate aldolase [Tessaracoccus sp. OS52]MCC2594033.1 ketose-bisphosphate aldolase [Tessaracoccus sp. OS52]
MTTKTLRHLLGEAEAGRYGVGAFNVSDLNQAVAVLDAARAEASPVIVQAIAGMHPYQDEIRWWKQLRALVDSYSDVSVALHLDHGRTLADCTRAMDTGFTSVMIDASRRVEDDRPASLEDNIARTAEVVALARRCGVSTEGELGTVGGAEAGIGASAEDIIFADPDTAAHFVEATGVDALAVAVGTSHGAVKFTTAEGGQTLRLSLISAIKERLPDTFLVLHGSSSIPPEHVRTINAHGGKLPESYGVSSEQKQEGIAHGIRKINQGTDSHLAWTAALREFLTTHPSVMEPSEAIACAMSSMRAIVSLRMREFGSSGQSA